MKMRHGPKLIMPAQCCAAAPALNVTRARSRRGGAASGHVLVSARVDGVAKVVFATPRCWRAQGDAADG